MWIQAVGQCDQEWFPGPSRKACQEVDFPWRFSLRIVFYLQSILTICIVLCYAQFKQSILPLGLFRICTVDGSLPLIRADRWARMAGSHILLITILHHHRLHEQRQEILQDIRPSHRG